MIDRRIAWVFPTIAFALFATASAHALTYAGGADNIAYVPVHQMGYTGSGVIVGVVDVGTPETTHPTYYTSGVDNTSRVTRIGDYGDITVKNHPTSVAGIMAGRGPGDGTYLGVAPGAEVWAGGTDGDVIDIKRAFIDFTTPDNQGRTCKIYGMSLGAHVDDNGYDPFVMFLDYMAREKGAFISVPSGNDPDAIWIPGGNYNLLTVGALTADLMAVSPISGRGPTILHNRSKPDVLAHATDMFIPVTAGLGTWYQGSGSYTSNSAPFGAGVAALLKQYSDESGAVWNIRVIKAVIMNSATKLPGWSHSENQPLDQAQGAGRMNALHALYQYMAGEQDPGAVALAGWDRNVANSTAERFYHLDGELDPGYRIVATLAWFRKTEPSSDNLLEATWSVDKFEALDLYLYRDSDCSIAARSTGPWDSVEHIYWFVDDPDNFTLGVKLLGTGLRTESYGLAWFAQAPGDANWDGKVDGGDLSIWQQNYDPLGLNPNTWEMGDWNCDNRIDGGDLALWQQFYGPIGSLAFDSQPFLSSTAGIGVPEPATIALLGLGLTAGAAFIRRKRT